MKELVGSSGLSKACTSASVKEGAINIAASWEKMKQNNRPATANQLPCISLDEFSLDCVDESLLSSSM